LRPESNKTMLLALLAYYERASTFIKYYINEGKHVLRALLGPEPQNWYLLPDGRVLPTTMPLPPSIKDATYLYHVGSNRITTANEEEPAGRFRPLRILGMSYEHDDYGSAEITDWVGELRANPVMDLNSKQLLTLYSLATNHFLPLSGGVRVSITKNDGEITELTYD
jgi:hypothetical protein